MGDERGIRVSPPPDINNGLHLTATFLAYVAVVPRAFVVLFRAWAISKISRVPISLQRALIRIFSFFRVEFVQRSLESGRFLMWATSGKIYDHDVGIVRRGARTADWPGEYHSILCAELTALRRVAVAIMLLATIKVMD